MNIFEEYVWENEYHFSVNGALVGAILMIAPFGKIWGGLGLVIAIFSLSSLIRLFFFNKFKDDKDIKVVRSSEYGRRS